MAREFDEMMGMNDDFDANEFNHEFGVDMQQLEKSTVARIWEGETNANDDFDDDDFGDDFDDDGE